MKCWKKEDGAATIEATLILPIFIAAVLAFISFANLALVEMRMQYAVNQTAKEVSQYYYMAYKFGLAYDGIQGNNNIDEWVESINTLKDTSEEVVSSVNVSEIADQLSQISQNGMDVESLQALANSLQSSFDGKNPIDLLKTLVASYQEVVKATKNISTGDLEQTIGNTAGAVFSTLIAQPISKTIFPKYIADDNTDKTLNAWMIEDGMDGLDFSASSFLLDGQTIQVVVTYKVRLFTLGFWTFEKNMSQVASTRAWIGDSQDITSYK